MRSIYPLKGDKILRVISLNIALVTLFYLPLHVVGQVDSSLNKKSITAFYGTMDSTVAMYELHERHSSIIARLTDSMSFYFELQHRGFFEFAYGTYTYMDDSIIFSVDTVQSRLLIGYFNFKKGNFLWDYIFWHHFPNLEFGLRDSSLIMYDRQRNVVLKAFQRKN